MEPEYVQDSTAYCKICKQHKPRADFQRSTHAKNGLQPRCRRCQSTAWAESRARSKQEKLNPRPWNKRPRRGGQQRYCETCVDYYNNNSTTCPYCRTEKACKECHIVKPLAEFYVWTGNVDGRNNACIQCFKDDLHHGRNYGLRRGQYAEMLKAQNGVCAICRLPPEEGKRLHVDHDHETLAVRGLLCLHCNHGVGNFRDSVTNLLNAIAYLKGTTK